ncbi:MAG: HD domain-containing protein [Lachnospiraceae bacterium]|nr:HD domain-containing protein [Lachnospiraceae bacterium]
MKFVRMENLKTGMRLARPIYSKSGVLLFERDSQLSSSAIESVKNFGLLGIYILEPAEPLPPMSDEDKEFERFQTMMVASIQDELERIINTKHSKNILNVATQIIRSYGHVENKINFYQNLRSRDDFVSRHSLNVAMLCVLMSHILNLPRDEQQRLVFAALVHDIGRLKSKNEAIFDVTADQELKDALYRETTSAYDIIEEVFATEGPMIKRICNQALRVQKDKEDGKEETIPMDRMVIGSKILLVANVYDEKTAMNLSGESESEVKAIKEFLDHPEIYDKDVVNALIASINILFPGVSVELSTGEKALVLTENVFNILQPTVLCFKDNSILDMSLKANNDIYVMDIMKTLDNRYIMDTDKLKNLTGGTENA